MLLTEVVLAILLREFKFEPSDKEVTWMPAPVMYPTVAPDRHRSQLPLRVTKCSD